MLPSTPTAPRHAAAATPIARHPQGVSGCGRQRRHRPRRDARRDPRGAGRERRRQVDADEDRLRRDAAHRGRDVLGGRSGHAGESRRRARARHRHGVPAFLAVRDADRRRERRAGGARGSRPSSCSRGRSCRSRSATACRSIRAGSCTRCRSASGSASRSSAACCRRRSSSSWTSRRPCWRRRPSASSSRRCAQLAAEGCSILYISHKLDEIQALCHTATVLRAGKVTGTCVPAQETPRSMARMMIGKDLPVPQHGPPVEGGEVRLRLAGLSHASADPFGVDLKDLHLDVHSGEIVGIAGVSGNGQKELLLAVSGEEPVAEKYPIQILGTEAGRMRAGPTAKAGHGLRAGGTPGTRRRAADDARRECAPHRAPARDGPIRNDRLRRGRRVRAPNASSASA